MVCGAYSGLVRPGNGVGANKWIIGGLYTDTERCSTRMPPQCGIFRLVSAPLVRALEVILPSIKIGRQMPHGPVIGYANDQTVFVTQPEAFGAIHEAIRTYERATGACLNPLKSKALAVGAWTDRPTLLGIDIHERVEILGVEFGPTVARSIRDSWSRVTGAVRGQARRAYARHMCLVRRMQYVQLCLFAKIWYVAQVFPLPQVQAQLTTICSW
jgi:hypothetical protein